MARGTKAHGVTAAPVQTSAITHGASPTVLQPSCPALLAPCAPRVSPHHGPGLQCSWRMVAALLPEPEHGEAVPLGSWRMPPQAGGG